MGRVLRLDYAKYWSWEGTGWGTGIAPSRPHPSTIPRVHPSHYPATGVMTEHVRAASKYGRGAHIRRPTHFKGTILRDKGLYRGL